jgi:hypothetical protein
VIYAQRGKMKDALRETTLALSLDPDNRVARKNLSNFQRLLKKE